MGGVILIYCNSMLFEDLFVRSRSGSGKGHTAVACSLASAPTCY
jgi:hypothetical protein